VSFLVGLISDTHGLLRPEAIDGVSGSDAIIHAGDVGRPEILDRLAEIAPVTAVRGNIDVKPWAQSLPVVQSVVLAGVGLFVIHDQNDVARHPVPPDARIVVFGHSHKTLLEWRADGRLWINPGSAGPRRFRLPVSVGRIRLDPSGGIEPELVTLL